MMRAGSLDSDCRANLNSFECGGKGASPRRRFGSSCVTLNLRRKLNGFDTGAKELSYQIWTTKLHWQSDHGLPFS
jgi:hypothetical protein